MRFILFITFRGLHLSTTKIQALDVLLEISKYCCAETILDRIVPYIVSKSKMYLIPKFSITITLKYILNKL